MRVVASLTHFERDTWKATGRFPECGGGLTTAPPAATTLATVCCILLVVIAATVAIPAQAQPTGQAPAISEAEKSTTEEEFDLEAELEALIAELDPPSLEEILAWFEPIPTVEELLAPLPDDDEGPHTQRLSEADRDQIRRLGERIDELYQGGQFAQAVPLAQNRHNIRSAGDGPDHWLTKDAARQVENLRRITSLPHESQEALAQARMHTVTVLQLNKRGEANAAIPPAFQSLLLRWHVWGASHETVASSCVNLAECMDAGGSVETAERLFRAGLVVYCQTLGSDHPDTADALALVAYRALLAGRFWQSERCHRKVLEVHRRCRGWDDTRTINALILLALSLTRSGSLEAAERAYERALPLARGHFGEGSGEAANVARLQGELLMRLGDYAVAETTYEQVIPVLRQRYGPNHNSVAASFQGLARSYWYQGKYRESETAYQQALALFRSSSGEGSRSGATVLENLGELYEHLGLYDQTIEHFVAAENTWRAWYGEAHPHVAANLKAHASLLVLLGNLDEAETLARKALSIEHGVFDKKHHLQAYTLSLLARIQHARGDMVEAEREAREALVLARETLGNDHVDVAYFESLLAKILGDFDDVARLDEAEALHDSAVAKCRRYRLPGAYQKLVSLADFLREKRARCVDAIPIYEEAIDEIERLECGLPEAVPSHARFHSRVEQWDAFGGIMRALLELEDEHAGQQNGHSPRLERGLACIERGRGRALLHLLDQHNIAMVARTRPALRDALERKADAHRAVCVLTASAESVREDRGLSVEDRQTRLRATEGKLESARLDLTAATSEVQSVARDALNTAGLRPLGARELRARLQTGELLLLYEIGQHDSILLALDAEGGLAYVQLAWPDGRPVTRHSLEEALASYRSSVDSIASNPSGDCLQGHDLAAALVPSALHNSIQRASRVLIVPDGHLHGFPFDLVAQSQRESHRPDDVGPPIVYGPSATVIMTKRKWARERKAAREGKEHATALVAVGDAIFARPVPVAAAKPGTPEPEHGVLLAMVVPDSNAGTSGLRAGDVLLSYDGVKLGGPADLGPAIQESQARRHAGTKARTEAAERQSDEATKPRSEQQPGAVTRGGEVLQPPTTAPAERVPVAVWRDGRTLELTLAPGRMGVRPSQCAMPTALHDWRELQLSEDERFVKYASATTRSGFGETLQPLPGTRVEVNALADVMKRAGVKPDAVKVLTGEDATLTNVFQTAESPRFLHLATHGKIEGGRRVYESALALTVPEEPTPDDFGFLRLQDLLYKWGGKLEGTELVVLSGCATATGRLEAADGFVGLTWGFLFAGADSVIASLWKVDDAATVLLMHRLYENLLGVYDEPRMGFEPGTEMPKAEALHEAKRWLRHQTPEQNREMLTGLGMDTEELKERYRTERGRLPTEDPQTLPRPFDYSAPRFWAAFVLIGSPD